MLTRSAGENLAGGFSAFDFSARRTVIAAVSGGSDSLALLLLLKAHLQRAAPASKLAAVTIDHALRGESAAEAEQVSAFCAARGIGHRILRWEGDKPRTGLSAAAREARYRLLAKAAADAGTDLVFTGHTADDQAETVLMRKDRGEGRGLAGMAPATLYDGRIWIARPLLGIGREALRIFLRHEGVEWADDPGNADPAYERVRAREAIAADPDPRGLKHALLAQSSAAATARIERGESAASIIRSCARQAARGLIRLDGACLQPQPRPVALHALRLLLATVGGRDHLPEESRAAELLKKLEHGPCRATLSGAAIDARKGGIFLHREFRGGGPRTIPAVDGAVWDGRFRIFGAGLPGHVVAPLGRMRAAEASLPDELSAPASLVRAALASQPSPLPDGVAPTPLVAPYARFLPSFDLAPAQALAALVGAPPFPPAPFAGHIAT